MRWKNKLVLWAQDATVHRHSTGEIIVACTNPFALDGIPLLGKGTLLGFKLTKDIAVFPQVHVMNRVTLGFGS